MVLLVSLPTSYSRSQQPPLEPLSFFDYLGMMVEEQGEWVDPLEMQAASGPVFDSTLLNPDDAVPVEAEQAPQPPPSTVRARP